MLSFNGNITLSVLNDRCFDLAERARLSGLTISSSTHQDGPYVELYHDNGPKTSCGLNDYNNTGTSICGDVLRIPFDNTHLSHFVKISTPSFLNLCEVEIFAGSVFNDYSFTLISSFNINGEFSVSLFPRKFQLFICMFINLAECIFNQMLFRFYTYMYLSSLDAKV